MWVQYDTPWERRDVLGVHPQKQEGYSWVGACVPAGRLFPEDFHAFADVAEKCVHCIPLCVHCIPLSICPHNPSICTLRAAACLGGRKVFSRQQRFTKAVSSNYQHAYVQQHLQAPILVAWGCACLRHLSEQAALHCRYGDGTVRLTVEQDMLFPFIPNDKVEAMKQEPIFQKYKIDAGNLERGLVSCTGAQVRNILLIDIAGLCWSALCDQERNESEGPPAADIFLLCDFQQSKALVLAYHAFACRKISPCLSPACRMEYPHVCNDPVGLTTDPAEQQQMLCCSSAGWR